MRKRKKKSELAKAASTAGDTITSAAGTVGDAVVSGIDEIAKRGRKARKSARAEAEKRRKAAKKRAQKTGRRTGKKLADLKSDAADRSQAVADAAAGKPKRSKKKTVAGLLGVAGATALAMRSRGQRPPDNRA